MAGTEEDGALPFSTAQVRDKAECAGGVQNIMANRSVDFVCISHAQSS